MARKTDIIINIEKILREVTTEVEVIVIDCFEPIAGGFLYTENKKILDLIQNGKSGINNKDIQFIQYYSFPHILSSITKKNKKAILLLGTHGVLDNNDLLCKVGSELLAITAKEYRAQIVALAEKSKYLNSEISPQERDAIDACIAAEKKEWHPKLNINCVEPRMDLVRRDLVNVLITEEGITSVEPATNSEKH